MEWNWQWFLGGRGMFIMSTILLIIFIGAYTVTFFVDPTTNIFMNIQSIDETSIKDISESYMETLGVKVSKPVVYRFVKYQHDDWFNNCTNSTPANSNNNEVTVLLGTFHEWNDTYYIDISANIYRMNMLYDTVKHETRHMLVQELNNKGIIDLIQYTEEIAEEKNEVYNNLFNCGIKLLKEELEHDRV